MYWLLTLILILIPLISVISTDLVIIKFKSSELLTYLVFVVVYVGARLLIVLAIYMARQFAIQLNVLELTNGNVLRNTDLVIGGLDILYWYVVRRIGTVEELAIANLLIPLIIEGILITILSMIIPGVLLSSI